MEEDIKILEQAILTELYGHDTVIVNKKSLENLIKGYRGLEVKNAELNMELAYHSIPKSKIKENIKEIEQLIEYEKQYGNVANREKLEFKKEIYLEFMEDK